MRPIKGVLFFLVVYITKFYFVSSEEDLFQDVKFRYYYGVKNTTYNEYFLNASSTLITHPQYRLNQTTIFYAHGWNQKVNEDDVLSHIVNSYLQRNEHNVVVLNYEKLAANFYPIVVAKVPQLGEKVASALIDLIGRGLNHTRIHLIGFSLGAHVCGEIGRSMRQRAAYVIPRITGLDPALPLYYGTGNNVELNKKDASFVDIIHTDGGICGGLSSSGHADFFPNGGVRPQPRCGFSFWQFASLIVGDHCPHDASAHYYAESVAAVGVKGVKFLATNRQNSSITAYMGYNCSIAAAGDFYLKTD